MKSISPQQVRSILVRGTNWVGDAVMSVPALKAIRRAFPKGSVSLLVRPWVRDVYSAVDFVDEVVASNALGGRWKDVLQLSAGLRARNFDLAILLQNALEAAVIAWWARIPIRLGYARDGRSLLLTHALRIDPAVREQHQIHYYLGILSAAGLVPARQWEDPGYQPSIEIGVLESDRAAARRLLLEQGVQPNEALICLNPGASYGPAKRWFSDRYAAVADAVSARYGARIVILGSAGERAIAEEVARSMKHTPVIMAGRTTLGQLMGLLKQCRLLITNDSGPMHLAAALGVPQLAIFGSTSEIATGPLHPDSQVIKQPVECSPCFLRECPIDFRCMTRITPDQVVNAAEGKLGAGQQRVGI